jgi:hypothetical protein
MSKSQESVKAFIGKCAEHNFVVVRVSDSGCVEINAEFPAQDSNAFMNLDNAGHAILRECGSNHTWGTDGIAAMIALRDGQVCVIGSGFQKRFIKALKETLGFPA